MLLLFKIDELIYIYYVVGHAALTLHNAKVAIPDNFQNRFSFIDEVGNAFY